MECLYMYRSNMPSSMTLVAFHNQHRPVTGIVMIFVQIFPATMIYGAMGLLSFGFPRAYIESGNLERSKI